MDRTANSSHDQQQRKLAHPLGTVVFCIHCFRTLGTESPTTTRENLQARHMCLEGLLAKLPGAPPPYN